MTTALLIFPAIAILCVPALWLVMGRPRFLTRSLDEAPDTSISIIIPARNEETNIRHLLESIQEQATPPHQVIVVDDGSTDRTAAIAKELGAQVVPAKPLPDGWKGKPWACTQGVEAATGEWLLFLDADTRLTKQAIQSLSHLTSSPDSVYSICPYHTIKRPYEELSAFFNTLMLAGSYAFGLSDTAKKDTALFGQCMLISKEHYQQVGGHTSVRNEVLENFHLSSHLKKLGIHRTCYLGKSIITMRMFPGGLKELWASWQKGFSNGASNAAPRALLYSSIWISGLMFTLVSLFLLLTPYTSPPYYYLTMSAYIIGAVQCYWVFKLAGSFSLLNALLFPISLTFYQVLFFSSIIARKQGKQTQWKGRNIN